MKDYYTIPRLQEGDDVESSLAQMGRFHRAEQTRDVLVAVSAFAFTITFAVLALRDRHKMSRAIAAYGCFLMGFLLRPAAWRLAKWIEKYPRRRQRNDDMAGAA
jgi:hypothetical protein